MPPEQVTAVAEGTRAYVARSALEENGRPAPPMALVGTFSDLLGRAGDEAGLLGRPAERVLAAQGIPSYSVSSKRGDGIAAMVAEMVVRGLEYMRKTPVHSGWLSKRGGGTRLLGTTKYRRRYFVLWDRPCDGGATLEYYEGEGADLRGSIPLAGVRLSLPEVRGDHPQLVLESPGGRAFHLQAVSRSAFDRWAAALAPRVACAPAALEAALGLDRGGVYAVAEEAGYASATPLDGRRGTLCAEPDPDAP